MSISRIVKGLLGLVAALLVAGVVWAWHPALAPVATPLASSFPPAQVAEGARLAAAGSCAACHTAPGGAAYGGGVGIETGYGLAYSTNISPDVATGIGGWSVAAFTRAMREGVDREGAHLFPVFPYTHYTLLSDADVDALYAYFMSQPPVVSPERANTLRFPFNLRGLQAGWKALFFKPGRYQPVEGKGDVWNRGAYLAEGITHCAACHTPHNRFGAEKTGPLAYAGAAFEGWLAPPLNASNPAPLPWTEQDLYDYLRTGESEVHGVAAGVMASVVHFGLAPLPDADIRALATYFADTNGSAGKLAGVPAALAAANARRLVDAGQETDAGANLYLAACASCHYSGAPKPPAVRGSLALSSSLTSDDPANFIQTILQGVGGAGLPGPYMPGYAGALTNADIATLAAYMRRTRTDLPAWANLSAAIAARRPEAGATTPKSTPNSTHNSTPNSTLNTTSNTAPESAPATPPGSTHSKAPSSTVTRTVTRASITP